MLERGREYPFEAVVDELKRIYTEQGTQAMYDDNNWCVYVREDDIDQIDLDTLCYIDEYPDITDDDDEILPEFILEKDCELAYRDEMLQDIVISALDRKADITNEELMEAIDYYDNYDTFMEV